MENCYSERQIISDFTQMSEDALTALISQYNLKMTLRDLRYCQNQYRMRERREPTLEELLFLDALYYLRTSRIEFHGLRAFYTSDRTIAETYADMIAKSSRTRREERPYTPAELSGVLTQSLIQAGKQVTVPSLCTGHLSPLHALKNGRIETGSISLKKTIATVSEKHSAVPTASAPPQATDHLILLTPAGLSPSVFATRIAALDLPANTQILPVDRQGLIEALLRFDGVYLVQSYLPGMNQTTSLTDLVDAYTDSVLLRVDGELAISIRNRAAEAGLVASIIGKCATNRHITIRREGESPIQLEADFLRAFSPVLPADIEIPHLCTDGDIHVTDPLPQTVCGGGDCALFATEIPETPYAIQGDYLLTGAVSYPFSNPFLAALYTTIHAVNRAVAAGIDYEKLTLSNQIVLSNARSNSSTVAGELIATQLGAYRAQAELALPDIGGQFCYDTTCDRAILTTFAAAPKAEQNVPHTITASGHSIYLLTPIIQENGVPDFEDYRKLLRYVHHLCRNGIALSAIAIDAGGIYHALSTMAQNGYGFLGTSAFPSVTCGFLIETTEIIQGTMLGITSAAPTIRTDTEEIPITSFRFPRIVAEQIPMSDVGVDHPVVCIAQTKDLGSLIPVERWIKHHHAVLKAVPVAHINSRKEMTALASAISESHITILLATQDELAQIQSHPRVAYALKHLIAHGGLLLCLSTDTSRARNAIIPTDHPMFYRIPEILYERCAVQLSDKDGHIVQMCADSAAIPHMIASAIAYFQ